MRKGKKKIYEAGDQINLRLSKSRVTQDVIDAINKANEEDKVNEFAMTAFEFFVRYNKQNKYITVDKELKNNSNTEYIELKEKSEFKTEEKVKLIKENEKNNAEDEVFGNNGSGNTGKKGLSGSFSALRRTK